MDSSGDCLHCLVKRRPTRGTSRFEACGRDSGDAQPGSDVGGEMVLTDEGRSGEVAQIECFHLRRLYVAVFECFLSSLYGERAKVTVGERAEVGFANADDGYLSHTFKITRRLCRRVIWR